MLRKKFRTASERLEKYSLFSEHSRDIILFVRPDGRIVECNQAAVKIYGYSKEELLTMNVYDLRNEDNDYVNSQIQNAMNEGILFETYHRKKDGTVFPIEVSSRGVELKDGPIILSIIRDVTDRKHMEDDLVASDRKFKLLAESINEVFGLVDSKHNILYVNPAFEEIWGISRSEIYKNPGLFFEAIHPEDRKRTIDVFFEEEYVNKGIINEQGEWRNSPRVSHL